MNCALSLATLFSVSSAVLPVNAATPMDVVYSDATPRVSYTRSTSTTVNGCVITASIVYDGSTGKINRCDVTKSNNNVNIQWQYWITNNGYTCTFDVDIYIPGQTSPKGWNPVINSPGPTR